MARRTATSPAYSTTKIAAEYLSQHSITSPNTSQRRKSTATQTPLNLYKPLHSPLDEVPYELCEEVSSEQNVLANSNARLVAASRKLILADTHPMLAVSSSTAPASLRTTPSPSSQPQASSLSSLDNNNITQQPQSRMFIRASTMQEIYHGKRYLETGLAVGPFNNYFASTVTNANTPSGGTTPTTPSADTPGSDSQWATLFHSFETVPVVSVRGASALPARLINMESASMRSTSTLPSIDESASECMSVSSTSTHTGVSSMPTQLLSKRQSVARFYSAPTSRMTTTATATVSSISANATTLSEDETDADAWQVARCGSSEDFSITSSGAQSRSSSIDLG